MRFTFYFRLFCYHIRYQGKLKSTCHLRCTLNNQHTVPFQHTHTHPHTNTYCAFQAQVFILIAAHLLCDPTSRSSPSWESHKLYFQPLLLAYYGLTIQTFIITVTHILRGSKRQLAPLYRTFQPRIQFADGRDRNCCCTFTKILT